MLNRKIFIIFILLLLFLKVFSLIAFDDVLHDRLCKVVILGMSIFVYLKIGIKNDIFLDKINVLLLSIPFFSIISANIIHGQSLLDSISVTIINLTYAFYFFIIYKNPRKDQIIKLLVFLGVCWSIINIVQQFSSPFVLFMEQKFSVRNGLINFFIFGKDLGVLIIFYFFNSLFTRRSISKNIIGLFIGLGAIYCLGTRQIFLTIGFCLVVGLFYYNKINFKHLCLLVILFGFLFFNFDKLFGEFIAMSSNDDWSVQARQLSWYFYGYEYNGSNIISIILGNGREMTTSAYGKEIDAFQNYFGEGRGYWRDDIGVVGLYSYYGLVYVVVIISYFIYVFRNFKYIPAFLRMYVWYTLLTSATLYHFSAHYSVMAISCMVNYIIRQSILEGKSQFVQKRRL